MGLDFTVYKKRKDKTCEETWEEINNHRRDYLEDHLGDFESPLELAYGRKSWELVDVLVPGFQTYEKMEGWVDPPVEKESWDRLMKMIEPIGDKLDDIIKHSTELGVYEIIPTIMKRSIFKLDTKKLESKLIRFNKIAKEAAEQSFRDYVPNIPSIKYLKETDFSKFDKKILCYEESAKNNELVNFKNIISSLNKNDKVAILIGPEGGIDDSELTYLKDKGFVECALGPRILRTETASFYCLSSISYELELKK